MRKVAISFAVLIGFALVAAAGPGLGITTDSTLSGTGSTASPLAVNTTNVQSRVSSTCAVGTAIRVIGSDGSVTCQTASGTAYTSGDGVTVLAGVISIDPTYAQRRVSSTCTAGSSIRAIAQDGTVTCETDDSGGITNSAGTNVVPKADASGNLVASAITDDGAVVTIGAGTDAATQINTQLIVENNGTTNLAIRDATSNAELQNYIYSGGGIIGTKTTHQLDIQANGIGGIRLATNGAVTILTSLTNNGNTTNGDANTDKTSTWGHAVWLGTAPALSSCGTSPTIAGTDARGTITIGTGGSACTITFSRTWTTAPSCTVTSRTKANSLDYTTSATALTLSAATAAGVYDYDCDCIGASCT
jgi:hypothetical protein